MILTQTIGTMLTSNKYRGAKAQQVSTHYKIERGLIVGTRDFAADA